MVLLTGPLKPASCVTIRQRMERSRRVRQKAQTTLHREAWSSFSLRSSSHSPANLQGQKHTDRASLNPSRAPAHSYRRVTDSTSKESPKVAEGKWHPKSLFLRKVQHVPSSVALTCGGWSRSSPTERRPKYPPAGADPSCGPAWPGGSAS